MARPKIYDDDLRARLLATAAATVSEQGVDALSLRRLAADEHTSTTAVYSLFGGRTELLHALLDASFRGFGEAQRAAPITGDSLVDIRALGLAYRSWGLANPHLYRVMFGGALGGTDAPVDESKAGSTMYPLQTAVEAGVAAGALGHAPPEVITHSLWAVVHGLLSLELTVCAAFPDEDRAQLFESGMTAVLRGWTV